MRTSMRTRICLSLALAIVGLASIAHTKDAIPKALADRLPPGGFRDVKWLDPCPGKWAKVDVTQKGIKPGNADMTKALQALVNATRKPTVLFFPAGTYRFSRIAIHSDLIIKGAGPDKTLFKPVTDGTVFGTLGKGGPYEWPHLSAEWKPRKLTRDVQKGAETVSIESTKGLQKGDTIMVIADLQTYSYAKRGLGGVFVVTKVVGSEVSLNLPLALGIRDVSKNNAIVAKIDPVRNVGFQDFRIEAPTKTIRPRGKLNALIHIKRSRNVYVKNVESFYPLKHHVTVAYSHRVVVEGCFFDEAKRKGGGGYGYGTNIRDLTTLCKVENCILKDLRHFLATEVGANYCIYAYNFSVDRLRDFMHSPQAPKKKVKQWWLNDKSKNKITSGFITADTVAHGNSPHSILLEGNVFYNGCVDASHRSNGPHYFFRNKALGQPHNYDYWQEGCGIVIMSGNDNQVVVGNYLANNTKILLQEFPVRKASENCLIAGNVVRGKVDWKGLPSNIELPRSLYLKSKPEFWPKGLVWPTYGPDVENSATNKLPAQLRYETRR